VLKKIVLGPVEGKRIVDTFIYAGVKRLSFTIEQGFEPLCVGLGGTIDAKAADLSGYHAQAN
jgi:hypothetical protein